MKIFYCVETNVYFNSQKGLRSILFIETTKFDLGFSNEPFLFSQSLDTVSVLYYVLLLCDLEPVDYNLVLIKSTPASTSIQEGASAPVVTLYSGASARLVKSVEL